MKNKIKEIFSCLSAIPTVSGFERESAKEIIECVRSHTSFFEEFEVTCGGSVLCHHSKGKRPLLVLDAHIDTVGFIVKEILDGGFLKVGCVGGIDKRILPSKTVCIYGAEEINGVFLSTPPHLAKNGDIASDDLFLDTGLDAEKLKSICPVGTPCAFDGEICDMRESYLCGAGMDDKICAAAIILFASLMSKRPSFADDIGITVSFSAHEEFSGDGAYDIARLCADGAVVLDVNFAKDAFSKEKESYPMGRGCGVSFSPTTHRRLTEYILEKAASAGIPCASVVETKSTGTNAHTLQRLGTPCAVLSVPEKYMHTFSEVVSYDDVISCANLLCEIADGFSDFISHEGSLCKVKGEIL